MLKQIQTLLTGRRAIGPDVKKRCHAVLLGALVLTFKVATTADWL